MKNFIGFLIKQQRLQQGLSQEALCKGICAVSYLSKIEQGLGHPREGILRQLLMALGISYHHDEEQLQTARETLDAYFDKYFHSESAEKEVSWLKLRQQELENSELHLNWHLFNLYSLLENTEKTRLSAIRRQHTCPASWSIWRRTSCFSTMPAPVRWNPRSS